MNEWIAPLTSFLIYLLFCPGCFVWVWLDNRMFSAEQRDKKTIRIRGRQRRGGSILKPVTTILIVGLLMTGCSTCKRSSAGLPARGTRGAVPAKSFYGNTGRRNEITASDNRDRFLRRAPEGNSRTGKPQGHGGDVA